MSYELERYNLNELRSMGQQMGLTARRSKRAMIEDISDAFREYEEYRHHKIDKYTRKHQLGNKGKEGTTYLVIDEKGQKFAMKTFRKTKASSTLKKEYKLQKKASKVGVSPRVHGYDTVSKYIVMDLLDTHLLDVMKKQQGNLRKYQQKRILEIFRTLDECRVFHGDANLTNYMLVEKQIYLLDFGFAKEITPKLVKKLGTDIPNMNLMLLGFILKLKELDCPPSAYKYLLPHIAAGDREKFQL